LPWPKEHKSRARARIVAAAAAALRAKGVSGVGVADIMVSAGLTHGGFYAHFPSKDDLLAEAIEYASAQTLAGLGGSVDAASTKMDLRAVVDAYLSPWHVTHVDVGCPVAALGPEIARAGGRMQRNLRRTIRARFEWLRGLIPADRRAHLREEQVAGALACMVGGLILARAVGGKESAELLEACRGFLHRALGDAPVAPDGRKPAERHAKKVKAPRRKPLTHPPRAT
jgi:TetR/AcrR family transcriptional repressor of nem operon